MPASPTSRSPCWPGFRNEPAHAPFSFWSGYIQLLDGKPDRALLTFQFMVNTEPELASFGKFAIAISQAWQGRYDEVSGLADESISRWPR